MPAGLQWAALVFLSAVIAVGGCRQQVVYRTASGLEFMLYHGDNATGPVAGSGATVKVNYTLRYGDSVLHSTVRSMPLYQPLIPGLIAPYSPMEALGAGVRPGDSLVVWQRVDSMQRKGLLRELPKGWRMSDRLTATMKVLAVFSFDYMRTDSAVRADKLAEATAWLDGEQRRAFAHMAGWLKEQSIAAKPVGDGVFVQVLAEGSGAVADSGSTVSLRYEMRNLSGRMLDANTDTSFHHLPVLVARLGSGQLPPVIDGVLRGWHSGSHLKIFIPLGVGISPATVAGQGRIPGDDLIWEVWW